MVVALLAGCTAAADVSDSITSAESVSLPTHSEDNPEIAPRWHGANSVFWPSPLNEFSVDSEGYNHLGSDWFALPPARRSRSELLGSRYR